MRIYFIGINYWPEQTGISLVTTGRAEYLAAAGHDVTIITGPPYYPQWRIPEGYGGFSRERRNNVEIRRCPMYVPRTVNQLRRILHEASFIASAFVRALFLKRPDALIVVSPPLGLAVAAAILSRWWHVPYAFDVEDLQPDAALDLGMMKPGLVTKLLYAVERLGYRRATVVSTLTEAMRSRIVSKGFPAMKVLRLGLWAEPELFDLASNAPDPELRRELGLADKFIVLHAGNMGVKQGLDVILKAASLAGTDPNVRYVLVGDGAVREALERRVADERLDNVAIIPLLPRDRFLRLLATAEMTLVTQQKSVADIVFPSKVLTLLAAAKPIVASVTAASEVARVVSDASAGLVIAPEDPEELRRAVQQLRNDGERRLQLGRAGREYAKHHFERETTLAAFAAAIAHIVDRDVVRREARVTG